jgi:phosphinothricin acetyltransferase
VVQIKEPGVIRDVISDDAAGICRIYNPNITEGNASFELEPVSETEMRQRIAKVQAEYPWLVWEENGELLGYAHASRWKAREAYRHTAELTVYLAPAAHGRGIGSALYRQLLDWLAENDVHMAMGVIALPNEASVALHESLGFAKVAHFREVGRKFGRWIDVGYWQRGVAKRAQR